jgi:hypothetical protein
MKIMNISKKNVQLYGDKNSNSFFQVGNIISCSPADVQKNS